MCDSDPREITSQLDPEEGELTLDRSSSGWELIVEIIEKLILRQHRIQNWTLDARQQVRTRESA